MPKAPVNIIPNNLFKEAFLVALQQDKNVSWYELKPEKNSFLRLFLQHSNISIDDKTKEELRKLSHSLYTHEESSIKRKMKVNT